LDGDGTGGEDACLMECFAQAGGGFGNRRAIQQATLSGFAFGEGG
jgi:hypothetical protein